MELETGLKPSAELGGIDHYVEQRDLKGRRSGSGS